MNVIYFPTIEKHNNICRNWLKNIPFFFLENLNKTVTKFEKQFRTSEYERLKLSSTVSSLEVAQMNMSKSRCGKFKLIYTSLCSSFYEYTILHARK